MIAYDDDDDSLCWVPVMMRMIPMVMMMMPRMLVMMSYDYDDSSDDDFL